jgi:dihydroceramidase
VFCSAEFFNTVSNVAFVYPTIVAVLHFRKSGLETRFLLCYIAMMMIGIGSICFHASLRWDMQLLDEFSMYALFTRDTEYCVYGFPCSSFRIYSGCLTVFALQSSKLTSGANGVKLGLGLLAFAASITIAYLYLQDPIFHQAASVALVRNHPFQPTIGLCCH